MVPDNPAAAVSARLTAMRSAYLERLRNEIVELVDLADRLASTCQHEVGPQCREVLTDLEARLHKLAGSCGTFGFSQLGEEARRLEYAAASFRAQRVIVREELRRLAAAIEALPTALLEENATPAGVDLEGTLEATTPTGSHIWVIDRDPLLASFVGRQLTSLGFRVTCTTQFPATAGAPEDQPDCFLIDHNADRPPSEEHPEGAPWKDLLAPWTGVVFFMGAREDFASRLHAERAGAHGYVAKPLDVSGLSSRIAHKLKDTKHAAERVLLIGTQMREIATLQERLTALDMEVHQVLHPDQTLHELARLAPELLLLDVRSGDVRSDELVGVIRQFQRWASMPIVVMAPSDDVGQLERALARGADAVLQRSTSPDLVARILRATIHRARERDALIARDGLTGLLKQNAIREALRAAHASALASRTPLVVAMLDIDHFKRVNDTHGHAVGDLVISTLASMLREHFRASDLLGRYGGEEFTVVLPKCSQEAAKALLNALREAFFRIQFVGRDQTFSVSLSAGIASTETFPRLSHEALLQRADAALYTAKKTGRNRVCVATLP